MKMVKSLFLGSAAGLVAIAGAQAADLPVKAKPVEYVKVCSLYGAGYYYIPGTDICMKIGGYVRAEYGYGTIGNSFTNFDAIGTDGNRTRLTGPDYQQRARAFIVQETRQQTAYGTLRTYMNVGFTHDFPAAQAIYANRAFMQIAGFTIGLATSFYDFYSTAAVSYKVSWSSDTGDSGWKVFAYTAQLGNGVSASLSFEEPRRSTVANASIAGTFAVGTLPAADMIKVRYPDVVANLRVDQAWGSAQIMGALHDASGGYYGATLTGSQANGHPADRMGWAAGAGIKINTPFISPGDYFQAQINYTQGAIRYAMMTPAGVSSPGVFQGGTGIGMGWFSDGVFCGTSSIAAATANCPAGGSGVELTTAWSAQASYEHFWTPTLRTSVAGAYSVIRYNDAASNHICGTVATGIAALSNCGPGSFNWSHWNVSSRTQWNITKDFYIGVEGYYARLNTMSKDQTATITATALGQTGGVRTLQDQNIWVGTMRVHRDIVP